MQSLIRSFIHSFIYMLNTYKRFWLFHWAEQLQYRANTLMYLLYWLVSPIVYMAVWTAVSRANGNVGGLTTNDFLSYYMVALVVNILCSSIVIHILGPKIEDGTVAAWLLQPVHPVLTYSLMSGITFKALQILAVIPIWAILYMIYQPVFHLEWLNVLAGGVAVVLGFVILFLHGCVMTFLAFWTTRIWALFNVYIALYSLTSGEFVPLELLPSTLQTIAWVLPYQLTLYFPTQLILGKISMQAALPQFGLQIMWIVIFAVLFRWSWRKGLQQYSSVGA